jgi:hypothetical protein
MISCFRTSFPVLERPFLFWNFIFLFRNFLFLFWNVFFLFYNNFFLFFGFFRKVILSRDVPGQRGLSRDICSCPCPGTKGHRDKKISLSRDKGTTGRPVPVCPGTSRPVKTLVSTMYTSFNHCNDMTAFIVVTLAGSPVWLIEVTLVCQTYGTNLNVLGWVLEKKPSILY